MNSEPAKKDIFDIISHPVINRYYDVIAYYDISSHIFTAKIIKNPAIEVVTNSYDEMLDKAVADFIRPADADFIRNSFSYQKITESLSNQSVHTVYFSKNQRAMEIPEAPFKQLKCDIFYLDNNHSTLVYIMTDVTQIAAVEKNIRNEMSASILAAQQASNAKTAFLSRISHEIRTPMNTIIGLDSIALQEKNLSVTTEDHVQKIGISAQCMRSLVDDFLDMSRIESGQMVIHQEPFNFEEFINEINSIITQQSNLNEIDYDCILKDISQDTYIGDSKKLQRVLINILNNAIKFTPVGGKIRLNVIQKSITNNKATLVFKVSDTGIGIDKEFLPHLFEPFSQENRTETKTYNGTGLGLMISKSMLTLMGGKIEVSSEKNKGSTFTIEITLGISDEKISKPKQAANNIKTNPILTLIIDDDKVVCENTQLTLNKAGMKSEYVLSGVDAINKITEHHNSGKDYDLILVDLKMPEMDGVETTYQIRKIIGNQPTIIMMTAGDWSEIESNARKAGVDMFMNKPLFVSSITMAFENIQLSKANEITTQNQSDYNFKNKHVLLAEDNALNAEIAKNLLETKHCTVETVVNGKEAVEAFANAKQNYYDAILMDVLMPVMDGLEAAKAIRDLHRSDCESIPIIAMTANAYPEDIEKSHKAGMNAHLTKPIDPEVLYTTLQKFICN